MPLVPIHSGLPVLSSASSETPASLSSRTALTPGESLTARVTGRLPTGEYLLSVKDFTLQATSAHPLRMGQALQVRVQSASPFLVFSVADAQPQSLPAAIAEGICRWLKDPGALTRLLSQREALSALFQACAPSSGLSAKDAQAIMLLMGKLVFSGSTQKDSSFLRDFASRLGMSLEYDLGRLAGGPPSGEAPSAAGSNLKALLLKLSSALERTLQNEAGRGKSEGILLKAFADDLLGAIASRQAVNVAYRQNESGLYLQIPLDSGGVLRQVDIFIAPDAQKDFPEGKFSSCSLAIFLDLDCLGAMAAEASLRDRRLRLVIRCESEQTRHVVAAQTGQLIQSISAAGYTLERLECLTQADLEKRRAEFIRRTVLEASGRVDHFA